MSQTPARSPHLPGPRPARPRPPLFRSGAPVVFVSRSDGPVKAQSTAEYCRGPDSPRDTRPPHTSTEGRVRTASVGLCRAAVCPPPPPAPSSQRPQATAAAPQAVWTRRRLRTSPEAPTTQRHDRRRGTAALRAPGPAPVPVPLRRGRGGGCGRGGGGVVPRPEQQKHGTATPKRGGGRPLEGGPDGAVRVWAGLTDCRPLPADPLRPSSIEGGGGGQGSFYGGLPPPPPCDSPSGCCSFTGPWTVTRSSLRMLRRVAAFCRPLRPVLPLVSFPRSRSPVVDVPGLCCPPPPPPPPPVVLSL